MTTESADVVCVATGTLIEIQTRHGALSAAGIESRVVGDHLTAGLGTALPGTVELWVNRDDLRAAMQQLAGPSPDHAEPHEHAQPDTVPYTEHGST
jgi:hypothetical protein